MGSPRQAAPHYWLLGLYHFILSSLTLIAFDVRDVAPIHVQRYGHISLSPAHRNPQGADALAYLYEQGMIFAGHAFMVTL